MPHASGDGEYVAAPSSLHLKIAVGSVSVNWNAPAVLNADGSAGFDTGVIVGSGGVITQL